jgi:diacylglycerol O-acyltransferase / wax synthase
MSPTRLSPLDASFLSVETPTAHMHVGWVALFDAPAQGRSPRFSELREHIGARIARAPRYRQKLAPVPLGLHTPEWVDDPDFSIARHVVKAKARPVEEIVAEVMSTPLRRDRPLWEMWVRERDEHEPLAIVGKVHHCMVDGLAAVELGSLLLDAAPEPSPCEPDGWEAEPHPDASQLLVRGVLDRALEQLDLLRWPARAVSSPARAASELAEQVPRMGRALVHSLCAAPASSLNGPLSPLRGLVWTQRPLEDLRRIKRAHGTTVNDVLLAAVASATRSLFARRGERPVPLKAMVPVSVRDESDVLGNRLSFVFAELPCEEPDPVRRLRLVNRTMTTRKQSGEPEGADLVFKIAERAPGVVQRGISKIFASPRTFNLVVSNIPGPPGAMYMRGCRLEGAYPVVPLADRHALSVGMTSVCGKACFGIYADREAMGDARHFARDIDSAIEELVAETS